jgi:hypothetical protein
LAERASIAALEEEALVTRGPGLLLFGALALLAGCASRTAPGPVSEAPIRADGERLRGPDADAESIDATPETAPRGADRLDWNGDRHVDREEFRNFFARAFHTLDADDDRLVRGEEAAKLPPESVRSADRNGDGALDVDEYVGLTLVWFVGCDRNADDVLGPDEVQACEATRDHR